MAGQLGLDPPTMTLSERLKIRDKLDAFLKKMRVTHLEERSKSQVLDPIFLYVLASYLPKRALVEVKPILYVTEDSETISETAQDLSCIKSPSYWGFQHADWHESCFQKCVVRKKICAIILSITGETAAKICSESPDANQNKDCQTSMAEGQMERLSRFCIFLLNKIIVENYFSWEDVINLRLYFPTSLSMHVETLSAMLTSAFNELAEMDEMIKIDGKPVFNLVPVLGAGRSATMDDITTGELFAQKS